MNASLQSFVDELMKISNAKDVLVAAKETSVPFLRKHAPIMAAMGVGGLGVLGIQRGVSDIRMAEQFRKQMRGQ